jgi:hypothetical protein
VRQAKVTSIKINNKKDYKRGVEKEKEWTGEKEIENRFLLKKDVASSG